MATKTKRTRTSCGYCTNTSAHRHQDCPSTLPTACAGKPWTCWCSENGHPNVIPPAPRLEVEEPDDEPQMAPETQTRVPEGESKGQADETPKATRGPKAQTARCGHPTKRGPCNRRMGHTAGHDGR